MLAIAALVLVLAAQSSCQYESHPSSDGYHARSLHKPPQGQAPLWPTDEKQDFWMKKGEKELEQTLEKKAKEINGKAKNIILFIGDGMSIPTVTATRVYKGQKKGSGYDYGEEAKLSWEEFPNVALSRTYSVDSLVPDSASTAFAMYSGVKTIHFTMGYDSTVKYGDIESMKNATKVDTVLKWAQDAGWETGFVTTTRVTHATPACLYAKSAHRDWECDRAMRDGEHSVDNWESEPDISRQLVEEDLGLKTRIILGGGLGSFTPWSDVCTNEGCYNVTDKDMKFDYNSDEWNCSRIDNRDLTKVWVNNTGGVFVKDRTMLNDIYISDEKIKNTKQILGLFSWSHMPFHDQRNETTPTLAEMTDTAVKFLQAKAKEDKGFFLMVESGRIDQAHHNGQAVRALNEGIALDEAVTKALDRVDLKDTLVIVTADHSHTFSIGGYPVRGNKIGGIVQDQWGQNTLGEDGLPYTVMGYANGPGFKHQLGVDKSEADNSNYNWTAVSRNEGQALGNEQTEQFEFHQSSGVPLNSETHGGDDVGIWATGPMAHLFQGVHQQSHIGHVMSLAGCIGPHKDHARCNGATSLLPSSIVIVTLTIILNKFY